MDFKDTLARLVRPQPQNQALHEAIEAGRQARFAEHDEQALQALDRAMALARAADPTAEIAIALQKCEILTRQGRFPEAESLLQMASRSVQTDAQRSDIDSATGMLQQARGDWSGARAAYEQALTEARRDPAALGAEGRALGHLGESYLHDDNSSYAAHLLHDSLAKLGGDNESVCCFTGLLGQAMIQNGQEADGQHMIDRALRLAEQIGCRSYQRRWAMVLGERALDEGRAQDAHAYFNLVLRLFAPETVSPEYVSAVTQMSKASASLRRWDEALAYAQIAVKAAEPLGDAPLQRQATGALGVALRGVGRSDEAIPYLRESSGEDAPTDVLRSLAAAQADSGDDDGAIATYQRAIKQAEASGKTLELAQGRRDLGLIYQRRREYQAAINEWTAALPIYDEHHAYAQLARLHCDIGSARKVLGQRARSMRDYEQALVVLNSLNGSDQETRGLVLSNAANAYAEQGDVESADAFFTEAISIAERLGDPVAESTRNGNYGWFLLLVGRPRRAIATLERALAISQPLNLPLQSAVQLDNLGLVYDSLGDTPAALERHRKALALVGDPLWAGQIKVNLAGTLIAMTQFDEAATLIDEALAQGREAGQGDLIVTALTGLARLLIAQNQPAAADEPLAEALALAHKLDSRRLLAEASSARSQQQAALGRSGESAAAWDEAQRLYAMLHMPQAKLQPTWLARSPTRPSV